MSATAKAWAKMIAEKQGTERKREKKKERKIEKKEREPSRVLIPYGGESTGRTWAAILRSLADRIELNHFNSKGKLYLTEREIGIHWLNEEKQENQNDFIQN